MTPAGKRIWREVVEARPADFFTTGSLNMLRTFCETSAQLDVLGPQMLAAPDDDKLIERFRKLAAVQASMGTKLRLSIQTELRIRTARNIEKTEPAKAAAPSLLGGKRSWSGDQSVN